MRDATSHDHQHFLFLLTSSRRNGNSELLARRAAKALDDRVEQRWIRLMDAPLPPFIDIRHEGDGIYPTPDPPGQELLQATLDATDIVFVAPLYWYGLPALAKQYLDHWSGWMRVPGIDFVRRMAGKRMWAVTALSDEDYSVADPLTGTLKLTASYLHMNWAGVLFGFGNRPADILNDEDAISKAELFFAQRAAFDETKISHG
jgi:putative NADPH-quinone reductase